MRARLDRMAVTAAVAITGPLDAVAQFLPYSSDQLSKEASAYQDIAFQVMAGMEIKFALARLLILLTAGIWLCSLLLIGVGTRAGLVGFAVLPLPVALSSYLNGAETAFPFLERPLSTLLLCLASALWGSAVCYGVLRSDALFRAD